MNMDRETRDIVAQRIADELRRQIGQAQPPLPLSGIGILDDFVIHFNDVADVALEICARRWKVQL